MLTLSDLRNCWTQCGDALGVSNRKLWSDALNVVLLSYEPQYGREYHIIQRRDHGPGHILIMLNDYIDHAKEFDMHGVMRKEVFTLAIILHDVIYDTRFPDSERRSGQYAYELLMAAGLNDIAASAVCSAIIHTSYFSGTCTFGMKHTDAAWGPNVLRDIRALDFLPLANAPYSRIIDNGRQCIEEAAAFSLKSWSEMRDGRLWFLNAFHDHAEVIFPDMWDKYVEPARTNAKREIEFLEGIEGEYNLINAYRQEHIILCQKEQGDTDIQTVINTTQRR